MYQQIKTINIMDDVTYEKKKERIAMLVKSTCECNIVRAWNDFVQGTPDTNEKYSNCCVINVLNANSLSSMFEIVPKGDIIHSLMSGNIDPTHDKYFIINDNFSVIGATDYWDFINIDLFLTYLENKNSAVLEWEKDSENAITLWDTPYECVKVELNRKWVKFWRRDDMLTCYTYPPLHELKKDKDFIECAKSILMESNQYHITEFTDWVNGNYDMPPFPLTCIFTSEFQGYKFHDFEED